MTADEGISQRCDVTSASPRLILAREVMCLTLTATAFHWFFSECLLYGCLLWLPALWLGEACVIWIVRFGAYLRDLASVRERDMLVACSTSRCGVPGVVYLP